MEETKLKQNKWEVFYRFSDVIVFHLSRATNYCFNVKRIYDYSKKTFNIVGNIDLTNSKINISKLVLIYVIHKEKNDIYHNTF